MEYGCSNVSRAIFDSNTTVLCDNDSEFNNGLEV